MFLIGNYPSKETFADQFQGEHLDIEVRSKDEIADDILQIYYGPVQFLKVLKDNSNELGKRIANKTRLEYERGPNPKTEKTLYNNQNEMARLLSKINTHSSDPNACFTNLGLFHRLSIQFWFELKNRWSLPVHKALPIIRTEDPKFGTLLQEIASSQSIEMKYQKCVEIQKLIWGS